MQSYIKKSTLNNYGVSEVGIYNSKVMEVFQKDIEDAVYNRYMIAISGEPGTGKTVLFSRVIDNLNLHPAPYKKIEIVRINSFDKANIKASTIIDAVLMQIAPGESRPRSTEARSLQFIRILGEQLLLHNKLVVVVLEEAHRVNPDLFRTFKEMREASYMNQVNLFSVVLIGHQLLSHKIKMRNETNWRTINLLLTEANGWFDYDERVDYLKVKYGRAIQAEARRRIATHCKLPLEIDNFVNQKMTDGMKAGKKILDSDVVQPSVAEVWEVLKKENPNVISYRSVAKEMNVSAGTISGILNGQKTKKQEQELIKTLRKISDENKENRLNDRKAS